MSKVKVEMTDETRESTLFVSTNLLSFKHGAVRGEGRAGFVIEFTVTFKEGISQVLDEAQVCPTQTCCGSLSLTSTNANWYSVHRNMWENDYNIIWFVLIDITNIWTILVDETKNILFYVNNIQL